MKTLSETIHEVMGIKPKIVIKPHEPNEPETRLSRIQENAKRQKEFMKGK
jgi:hypothetical protein